MRSWFLAGVAALMVMPASAKASVVGKALRSASWVR